MNTLPIRLLSQDSERGMQPPDMPGPGNFREITETLRKFYLIAE